MTRLIRVTASEPVCENGVVVGHNKTVVVLHRHSRQAAPDEVLKTAVVFVPVEFTLAQKYNLLRKVVDDSNA